MSVLFQALNRAASEYNKQQPTAVVPLLASEGGSGFDDFNVSSVMGVAALALLLAAGSYYVSMRWSEDRTVSLEQEQVQEASAKNNATDTSQGIMLSAESLSDTALEKDTDAVMQKIKDMPVAPEAVEKRARIVVHGGADESHALSADLAFEMQNSGRHKEAIEIWHQILLGNPNDDVARNNLVSALAELSTPEAEDELRQIADLRPRFAPAHASLAKLLANKGETSEASRYLQKALDIEPKNNVYRLSLAIFYDRMEQRDKALTLYNKALESRAADAGASLPLTWEAVEQRVNYLASR